MTFSNPMRRELDGLVPAASKTTRKISVPWSDDEQRAIKWMASTAPPKSLSATQLKLRDSPPWKILKSLSAAQLADLVAKYQRFSG